MEFWNVSYVKIVRNDGVKPCVIEFWPMGNITHNIT